MLPLLLLGGPIALAALLLRLRSHGPGARMPDLDRRLSVVALVAAVALGLAWPSTALRSLLGYVSPDICVGKRTLQDEARRPRGDLDSLKRELRADALDAGRPPAVEVTDVVQLTTLTGPRSPVRTDERWGVGSTDLGHPFVYEDRVGLLFGDTFEGTGPGTHGWRSNALAWVDETDPADWRIDEMHEVRPGRAGELLGSIKLNGWEQTVIPTNAVAVGDRIVMHYMSVACWGGDGRWAVRRSGLAVSDDGGHTFRRTGAQWSAGSGFAQVAFVPRGDLLYVFGIPEGRDGAARLARVAPDELLAPSAWRYWDGRDWVADEAAAAQVVAPPVGELSVGWLDEHERWLMVYLDEVRGGIVMRTAEELTGPWSRARLVASTVEFPQLYAPYLLPGTGDGGRVQFTMSRYDIYNVVLMEAELVAADGASPA